MVKTEYNLNTMLTCINFLLEAMLGSHGPRLQDGAKCTGTTIEQFIMHSHSQPQEHTKTKFIIEIIKGIVNNRCTEYPNPTDIEGLRVQERSFPKKSRKKGREKRYNT